MSNRTVNHNIRWSPEEDAHIRRLAKINGFEAGKRELSSFYRFLFNRIMQSDLSVAPALRRRVNIKLRARP